MFRVNSIMVMWLAWSVLLVHVFCQEKKPTIVVTPYQSTLYGTSRIVIQCTVSSSPVATSVGWKKISLVDGTSQDIDSQHRYEGYQIANSMINPHLTITNIAFSHEADYICTARNDAGTGQSNYGRINVTIELPSVTVTPEIQFPFVDTSKIIIQCVITSSPTASTVGWQRTSLDGYSTVPIVVANSNGKYHVDNSLEYPHLTINDISLADDAYYACFAINDGGKGISNGSRVDVIKSPLVVSVPVTEYSASIGSKVTLQCSITSSTATEVKWLKNNKVITTTARLSGGNVESPSLTINSIEQGDLGYYVCQATDGVRIVTSDDIFLFPSEVRMRVEVPVTQYSPTLLSTVKLQCEVTGSATSVKWFKNNILIVIANNKRFSGGNLNSPSLTIRSVTGDDFGYYTCQVTNGVDIINADQIAVLPKGIPPVISVPQPVSAPITGQQFIVPCITESNSSSLNDIQWIHIDFTGKIIDPIIISSQQPVKYQGSSVNNPSLVIHDYQSSDDGRYMCRATNSWGSSVIDAVLATTESVPTVSIGESFPQYERFTEVTLFCAVNSGISILHVFWQKKKNSYITTIGPYTNINKYSGSSPSTPQLTINNLDDGDEGEYTCFASNDVGIGQSSSTHLFIRNGQPPTVYVSQSTYQVVIHRSVTLVCTAVSNSIYGITGVHWIRYTTGGSLTLPYTSKYRGGSVSNPSLTIVYTDESDDGTYKCSVSDNFGTGSGSTRLYVTENTQKTECPSVNWFIYENSCYLFVTSQLDWFGAQSYCREYDAKLAEIETEDEDNFIRLVISEAHSGQYFWLGGTDNGVEGSWKWWSGTSFTYTKWNPGEPNDNTNANGYIQDYVMTNSNGWFDHESHNAVNYICEREGLLSVSAPVTFYSSTLYSNVTLECVVTGEAVVTWFKNENPIDIAGNPRFFGGTINTPSLTIISVEKNDLGYYTCHATIRDTTVKTPHIMLTTKGPSVLDLRTPITKYSPKLSSTVTLQCIITSGTPSSIDWHFNNNPMSVENNSRYSGGNINNPSLTITSVEQNDLGLYMCLASNEIVTINSDTIALLPVEAKPVVDVPQASYTQLAGQEISITCIIQSPNSQIQEVQWIFTNKEGKGIDPVILSTTPPLKYRGSNITNPSLTIMHLESSDAGQYSCRARSLIGTTVSAKSASLVIPEIPAVHISKSLYTVNLQDEITLECTAISNIALRDVFWVKDINDTTTRVVIGDRFHGSSIINQSLTISDVDNNDEGHYTCYASNTIGIGSSLPTALNVTGNANITITELTIEGEMINGRSVTVMCEAYVLYAEGTIFATWKLNNSVINPTNTSRWKTETVSSNPTNRRMHFRLIVLSLQTSDSGNLTCEVSDGYISSDKKISLNIIGKPIVSISPRTSTVTQGDTVNIYCNVVQSYSVLTSILWYKNGDTFNPNKGEIIIRIDNTHSKLVVSGIQDTVQYECSGINNYGEGNRLVSHISVIKPNVVYQYCPVNVDQFESFWVYTVENTLAIISCPGDRAGTVSRLCNSNGEWEEPNYSTCISERLLNLNVETDLLKNGIEVKDVNNILVDLNKLTEPDVPKDLTSGELDISSSILDNIAVHAKDKSDSISIDQLEIFVSSCDNLLVEKNIPSWRQLKRLNFTGVTAIAKAVTVYTKAYTNVNDSVFQRTVQKDQLVVQVGKVLSEDITFPKKTQVLPDWITESTNQVTLSKDNFQGKQPVGYSTTYYRNISDLFHEYYLSDGSVVATNGSYDINSVVIDFSIEPTPTSLKRPLIIKFEHVQVNYSNPVCAFWDFDAINTPNGAWSFVGSKLVKTSEGITVCQYDHTTNFALLMSPGRAPSSHSLVLSKISAVGCGISILFLVVTVMIHGMLWRQLTCDMRGRKIKRDKAILLVNFCVALTLSYILFLSGVTQTGNKKVCTAMAVLLHYIFLVDFAFMLAEGIEIAISVLFVFATSSRTKWLIPTCWVSPAVIVGISMGATKLDGYGNSQYCWLSVESNLIWAFVGPALTVILVNLIILILVLRTMFATHAMMDKTTKERAKAGIRSLCVILPLFGVTWVLGVFSVNEETVLFQYLFAVFNSLQGFFIFLFHTVFNQQIREGIQTMRVKRADKASIYSKQSSQKTTRESFATSTSDSQRKSSGKGCDSTSILKAKKLNDSLITSFENSRNTNQNSLKGDKSITPENDSKSTTDVHGPVKADNGKQNSVQNKSKSDGDNKKPQQANDNKDVVVRRSHTVASGSQNQNGKKSHKKDKRRSQYNSRPENISVYYFDNPVMSNDQTRRPAVENPSSTIKNEQQRIPDEYQDQRGNKIRWSADC